MSTNKNNALPGNPNTQVDAMLQETELGEFLSKNKNLAIGFVILLIVGIFGYGIFNSMNSKKNDKISSEIFEFESTTLKEFKDKKIKPEDFVSKFRLLSEGFGSFPGSITIILASSEELMKQGEANKSLEVLKTGSKLKELYANYIISLHLAAGLEDSKDYSGAIVLLEKLSGSKLEILRAKIYLDLGRLHLLNGDKSKAKTNFQYIIDSLQDKEMLKLAKIYLSNL